MKMQLFYFVLLCCLTMVAANEYTYKATWRFEKICQIYQFDFKKCHPCDKRFCGPPKIKANTNCQIFTCLSDLPIPTGSTSTSTSTTTTTTAIKTILTTTSTSTTTTQPLTTTPTYKTIDVKMAM